VEAALDKRYIHIWRSGRREKYARFHDPFYERRTLLFSSSLYSHEYVVSMEESRETAYRL
jgi:hypothetical protein